MDDDGDGDKYDDDDDHYQDNDHYDDNDDDKTCCYVLPSCMNGALNFSASPRTFEPPLSIAFIVIAMRRGMIRRRIRMMLRRMMRRVMIRRMIRRVMKRMTRRRKLRDSDKI